MIARPQPAGVDRSATNERAARLVINEWQMLAECCALVQQIEGVRSTADTAALEAAWLHSRCLINFLCGNYAGKWDPRDISPRDFLREDWCLPDEHDRELRGHLRIVNENLAHLSWNRLNDEVISLPITLVGWLVHWNMGQFVQEAIRQGAERAALFDAESRRIAALMPPRKQWESTPVEPAPPRPVF